MNTKLVARNTSGLAAACDCADFTAQISIAPAGTLTQGQPLCFDLTRIPNQAASLDFISAPNPTIQSNSYLGVNARQAGLTTAGALDLIETVVLPTSANAGPLAGIYQGPSLTNTSTQTLFFPIQLRIWGYGLALVGSLNAGVTVKVGSQLSITTFPSAANAFLAATAGVTGIAPGLYAGVATAYLIQAQSTAAIAAGAGQVVTPLLPSGTTGMAGISTSTPLLIDTPGSGVQETVTPSAVTLTTFTATFANAHGVNTPIVGSVTGVTNVITNTGLGTMTAIVPAYINIL